MFDLADNLKLPGNAITQAFAFLGRRGSGKTYGAGKLAELLLDGGAQVVIVDPVGTWFGLRLDAKGNAAGIPIPVFGGQHGDIPLEATAGALVAQLVAERGISVVLDVSEFSGAEQRRFVSDFTTELLALKKRHRSPLMVMFDESQEFVPQKVPPDHARMVGAMEKLVKLGRNFGVGVVLISQRPQAVNKDVLNQAEVLVVFQLTGPQERKTIAGWVSDHGFGQKEIDELPRLQPGNAFVWSPQWLARFVRVKIGRKHTFDASATPEAGDIAPRATLAPIDLGAVREAMAATVEAAKQSDPKALREEIARLRRQIEKLTSGARPQPDRKPWPAPVAIAVAAPAPKTITATTTPPEGWTMDEEALYQKFKARLAEEAPALIKVLMQKPGIEVTVERRVVEASGSSLQGRIACLIADGYFSEPRTNREVVLELGRIGATVHDGRNHTALQDLVAMGVLHRAEGKRYIAAPDAKVSIKRAA